MLPFNARVLDRRYKFSRSMATHYVIFIGEAYLLIRLYGYNDDDFIEEFLFYKPEV